MLSSCKTSMAAPGPERNLQEEATCSICLDYFEDPVMILDCGHNFCHACINRINEVATCSRGMCPQCRQPFTWRNVWPNRHMGNIVELAKQFSLQKGNEAQDQGLCKKHGKPLKLFCKEDQMPICRKCDQSSTHKNHSVLSMRRAAQLYQDKICHRLQTLKEERDAILSLQSEGNNQSQEFLREIERERQNLLSAFCHLRQLLEQQEKQLLTRLEKLQGEVEEKDDKQAATLSEEISHYNALIREVEQKSQEPAIDFLRGIGHLLKRCKKRKFQPSVLPDSLDLGKKLKTLSKESTALQSDMEKIRERLSKSVWIKENVMLDAETAHPRYVVSEDCKSLRWTDSHQELPYSPKRFELVRGVLGTEGFTWGKHYWKVEVGGGDNWVVGLARESLERKIGIPFSPEQGIWAVGYYHGQYKALTSPATLLYPKKKPEEIQVSLDCEENKVAFWDTSDYTILHVFESVSFEGESVFPFFRIVGPNTTLCIS